MKEMKGSALAVLAVFFIVGTASAGSIPHLLNIQGYFYNTSTGAPATMDCATSGPCTLYVQNITGASISTSSYILSTTSINGSFNAMIGPITPKDSQYSIELVIADGAARNVFQFTGAKAVKVAGFASPVTADTANDLTNLKGKDVFWDNNRLCYYPVGSCGTLLTCSPKTQTFDSSACGSADTDNSKSVSSEEANAYCRSRAACYSCKVNGDAKFDRASSNTCENQLATIKAAGVPSNAIQFMPQVLKLKPEWEGSITCSLDSSKNYYSEGTKYCAAFDKVVPP